MKQIIHFPRAGQKLLMLVAVLMMAVTSAWAGEVTVGDGTTSSGVVPVYGVMAYNNFKCQFIYSDEKLTSLRGKSIEQMVFYCKDETVDFGTAQIEVRIGTTTKSSWLTDDEGFTSSPENLVYTGSMNVVNGKLTIPFTSAFDYPSTGGNLLIETKLVQTGGSHTAFFYGTSENSYVNHYAGSNSSHKGGVLPKVTFSTPAGKWKLCSGSSPIAAGDKVKLVAVNNHLLNNYNYCPHGSFYQSSGFYGVLTTGGSYPTLTTGAVKSLTSYTNAPDETKTADTYNYLPDLRKSGTEFTVGEHNGTYYFISSNNECLTGISKSSCGTYYDCLHLGYGGMSKGKVDFVVTEFGTAYSYGSTYKLTYSGLSSWNYLAVNNTCNDASCLKGAFVSENQNFTDWLIFKYVEHEHDYATTWSIDDTNHWHACTSTEGDCDAPEADKAAHTYGTDITSTAYYTCSVCAYESPTRTFDYYKNLKKPDCDALQETYDETVCQGYVTTAKKNIDDLKYDSSKTLQENEDAVDAIITDLDAALKAHRLTDAEYCYNTVTAVGAKVNDDEHNGNYTALKALIDAKSTDGKAVTEAIEDCWRQYYYDKLSTAVIVETRYLNKEVNNETDYTQDDNDAENLTKALATAAAVYGEDGKIDKTKTSAEYKKALEDLEAVVTTVVNNQYEVAKAILDAQIETSTDVKDDDLAYDANKTDLQTYIGAATDSETAAAEKTKANVKSLRKASSDLATNTNTVVTTDNTQAQTALATAITNATTYNNDAVAPISDVVAGALADAIATAQDVKDNTATTAKQAKAAAETLDDAKATAEDDLADFKDAKAALSLAISNAKSDKATYDAVSVGAKDYLQDAIDDADAVATVAKTKTTQELKDATTALTDAQGVADATNTSAIALNGAITTATAAKTAAVDATEQTNIQNAIDAVKPDMAKKAKLSANLDADLAQLNDAVSGYVDADIAAQRSALEAKINAAKDAINNTMAYQTNKDDLLSDVATASAVDNNVSATAKQLSDAATTLAGQITSVTGTDDAAALQTLKNAITAATTRKSEIAAVSQEVADALAAKITVAEGIRDNDNSAKTRDAAATTLNGDVTTANTDLTTYTNDLTALKNAITAATTAKDGYADTHTGVKDQLADAIATAQDVVDNAVSTKTADIVAATTALNDAKNAADKANTAATNLETSIATANTTKETIVDATVKTNLENAISTAEAYLSDKTATEATLVAAKNTLDNAVSSNVTEDIDIARNALSDAIADANTAKDNLGYDANKTTLGTAITTATGVKDDTSATAKQLDDAKTALEDSQSTVVSTDLGQATTALSTALTDAKGTESELKALSDKIDAKYAEEKAAFNTAVITDLTKAISAAQNVQDADASTGKAKVEQVAKLEAAVTAANDALTLYYNTELQLLADEYTADKDLSATVSKDVTALDELSDFDKKFETAEEVYVGVKTGETKEDGNAYDAGDIISARLDLAAARKALTDAKTKWDAAVVALDAKIDEANTELAKIQLPAHQGTYDTLAEAIAAAQDVSDAKKTTKTDAIESATTTLDEAIKAAIEADEKWSFADATPDFKEGTYAAGNVTYTRSGAAIAEGNYGTFCLPFDVATSNFKAAYTPIEVSVLSADGNTLTLFLNQVEDETIPANTPFFAELAAPATENTLVLANATATDVPATPAKVTETAIKVYNTKEGSSLTTYNKDMSFVWTGTFAKTTDVENTYVFKTSGSFAPAANFVSPFRACLVAKKASPAKLNIVVDFGSEDVATAVQNVTAAESQVANGKIYTIDGQSVKSISQKGIYIMNGKKIVK